VCSPDMVEKEILAQNLGNFTELGTKMRRVLSQLMVRRTLLSRIPFNTGPMISNNIPGSQRKAFFTLYDKAKKDSYKAYETKNRCGLFVCDRMDPKKFHWNMGKLCCLVLVSSWLGFVFLEKSLSVNHIPAALNSLQKGKLIATWEKALPTASIIVANSEPPSGNPNESATNPDRTGVGSDEQARCVSNLAMVLCGSPKLCKMIAIIRD
jgi:hypothetical protein